MAFDFSHPRLQKGQDFRVSPKLAGFMEYHQQPDMLIGESEEMCPFGMHGLLMPNARLTVIGHSKTHGVLCYYADVHTRSSRNQDLDGLFIPSDSMVFLDPQRLLELDAEIQSAKKANVQSYAELVRILRKT